jgi:serine/threonine protein kinase
MAGAADFSLTPVINSAAFAEVYEQKEEVGAGAFSRVYRATQRATGKDFACKVVKKDHPDYDDAEMESEIRIARMVAGHPNVANIVDVFVDETRWYLVQELVMGGELFDIVIRRSEAREEATAGADARPYTEQEASLVVRQVLQALTHCHAKGVAHRDIKPENVLCDSTAVDSLLKLGDFGLAKIIPPDGIMTASSGTPEYVAPEVIARPPVGYGPGCDIWSVGVLTYILLCGFPPFYGDSPKDILASVKSRVVDFSADFFPSPEWDDISAEAKHLLVKGMLNRDPTQRCSPCTHSHVYII